MSDIEHIIEKENAAMFEYACNLVRLLAETEKLGFVTLRNEITNYFTEKRIGIKGHLNNYDLFTVEGIDSQRLQSLIKKYDIEGDIITDKASNITMLSVNKKSLNKLLELEKDVHEGTIDIEGVYLDYLKEQKAAEKQDEALQVPEDFEGLGDVLKKIKEQEIERQDELPDIEDTETEVEESVEEEVDSEAIFLFEENEELPEKEQKSVAGKSVSEDVRNPEDEQKREESEWETEVSELTEEAKVKTDEDIFLIDEELQNDEALQDFIKDAVPEAQAEFYSDNESQLEELDAQETIPDFKKTQPDFNAQETPSILSEAQEEMRVDSETEYFLQEKSAEVKDSNKKDDKKEFMDFPESQLEMTSESLLNQDKSHLAEHYDISDNKSQRENTQDSSFIERAKQEQTADNRLPETNKREENKGVVPLLSSSETLAEKDRNEKREALQKQLSRKENDITVRKIATGEALIAGYQDFQIVENDKGMLQASNAKLESENTGYAVEYHNKMPAKPLGAVSNSDYRALQDNIQKPSDTSGTSSLQPRTLAAGRQESVPSLTQEKYIRDFESRDAQTFTINHMQLQNRYTSSFNQNTFLQMGEMLLSGASEGYRVSEQGRGKSSYAGISAYSANRGYKALAKDVERLAYLKIDKVLKTSGNSYSVLNSFLSANGLHEMNFSTMKDSRNSMESLYVCLQKAGLASKRGNAWDIVKFETMYKRAVKRNDFSELARAFNMSGNHPYDWKAIVEAYADIMKRTKKQRTSLAEKVRSGKSMRSMIYHKLGQGSDVLNGYMQSKQAGKTVRSTYRAAKLFTILNGKLAWKVTTFIANRKIIENSLYTQGIRGIEKKKLEHEEKIKEKTVKKQAQKEERIKVNKKKKENRRETLKKRYDKVAPRFLRTNGAIGKRVGKVNQKIKRISPKVRKAVGSLNPFKIVAAKNLLTMKLKKWALIIAGVFMLFSMAIIILVISMTSVFGFFTGDENNPKNSYESIMGKSLQKLQKAEAQWASGLKNTTPTISLSNYSVRYGADYVRPEEYVPSEPNAKAEWNGHNVTWVSTGYGGYFTANPFGNYDVAGDVPLKQIMNFDGGVELKYRSKDGSPRTSNIKEILTMADIYFMFSMEAEDAHEIDSDVSISAEAKQSGLTYASSNESITAEDKELASGVIWDYCQNLFNVSHQEVIDLNYVVLPTCMTDISGGGDVDMDNEVNMDAVTFCPQGDIGGCSTFNNFVYQQDIKGVYDADGGFRIVGAVMPLQGNGQPYAEGEEYQDMCYADTVDGFYESLKNGHASCWEMQTSTTNSTICDYDPNTDDNQGMDIPEALRNIIGDNKSVIEVSYSDGFVTVETERGIRLVDHEVMVWVDEITKWPNGDITYGYYEPETHKDLEMETTTYTFKHKCAGNHKGRFCGGHLKADLTGVIYGFTNEQIASEGGGNLVGKIEDNAFVHKDVSCFTVNDENAMYASKDLFEVDSHVTHSSEREDWEGWTSDNMELAILKYNMDWDELYGITFASTVGGEALGEQQKTKILEAIQNSYPDLSEERMNVIKEALSWVGNIGYDQRHHSCPLTGPCVYNPNITCMMSDCSGFTSYLWKNRLGGVYTTASFYRHPMMTGKYNSNTVKPGDILVHYGGTVADGRDDHALLYLGNFEFDGVTQEWTVDCSTQNGVGNVFFRHRNYYPECYVVSPAP